jgi:exodeoxyribonuclease V gamma subunit
MFLHRSNRSESLVETLAGIIRMPLPDPLEPEIIAVNSKGMERWLAMQLSERLGVLANAEFPFPRHLIERLFDAVLQDPPEHSTPFQQPVLLWSIAALLPGQLHLPGFEPIARYLDGDRDGARLIQLAQRIARMLDDYCVFRPDLVLGWDRGEEPQSWEARLWRALCERHGHGHQAARARRLVHALSAGEFDPARLPARICLFGMSSLPPLYISLLSAFAARVETHLFVLSPSREYLGDLQRPRASTDSASIGHPLLASLGRLGREFQALLEEHSEYSESERDLYVEPGTDSLLRTLQSDMLRLVSRGSAGDLPRAAIRRGDDSIAIHVCHSRMRELEVLHDQLVALLERGELEPHEIVVMAPDIEAYAPVIEAVFAARSGRPALPYAIADRRSAATHPVVDALYALLEVIGGRMSATAVLDLLSLDCIRRRFGIESEELDKLRGWIEESGIRWGVDEAHRAEAGQPPLPDNTWRAGLARMLLGYALPGHGRRLYANVLPLDGIEGTSAELLGRLAEVCERLIEHRTAMREPRPVEAWRGALLALLSDLVDAGRDLASDHESLGNALSELVSNATSAGFSRAIDLGSMRAQLERALDARLPARGLLSRGISFCQLVPMRGIAFEVVCLIGMNDDAFPGKNPLLSFDRMNDPAARRGGDRTRRDDDRYVFLEALLCARRHLIVSYIGRGVRDNRVIPPSVVIGELLDAIEQGFEPEGAPALASHEARRLAIEQRLCLVHRLHAFSPRYFEAGSDPRLFSFSEHACDGARALGLPRIEPRLLSGELPASDEPGELTVDELVAWVTLPVRSFLQRKLGLYLGDDLPPLPIREPLTLDPLDRWKLGTELLELTTRGVGHAELLPIARGHGTLPLGTVGTLVFEELLLEIGALSSAANRHRRGAKLEPLSVELELPGMRVTGTLHELWPDAHLHASFSKLGRRFELAHYVRHLVLACCLAESPRPGYPRESVIVARAQNGDGVSEVRFAPIEDPLAALASLLRIVRAAQQRQLPFVHDVSRAYADALYKTPARDRQHALRAAGRQWGDAKAPSDPYVRLLYEDFAALSEQEGSFGFSELAECVFGPFLAGRSVVTPEAS